MSLDATPLNDEGLDEMALYIIESRRACEMVRILTSKRVSTTPDAGLRMVAAPGRSGREHQSNRLLASGFAFQRPLVWQKRPL